MDSKYQQVPRCVSFLELCHAVTQQGDANSVLPKVVADALVDAPRPFVLTDFAGRDSVAAAMAWLREHEVGTLIPVADVVPTRFGDWGVYEDNWVRMVEHIQREHPDVHVAPWFCLEDVEFWSALNGRFSNQLARAFGFFTPCLGCHLHFYAMRTVLAEVLDARVLLSGEKELHGERRKANQTSEAVAAYRQFSNAHGVQQHFPIHQIRDEKSMLTLLGHEWREGDRQLRCVMSGNDRGFDGKPLFSPAQITDYMEHFANPMATHIVALRRSGLQGRDFAAAVNEYADQLLARVGQR